MRWLKGRGFEKLQSRRRFWGVEIDVIAYHPKARRWWLVEVKSVTNSNWIGHRWSLKQRLRLERVAQAWAESHSAATQVVLALVKGPQLEVHMLPMEDVANS